MSQPDEETPLAAPGVAPPRGGVLASSDSISPSVGTPRIRSLTSSGSGERSVRQLASQAYLRIRKKTPDRKAALIELAKQGNMPELKVLAMWSVHGDWEGLYERERALALLSDDDFKPDFRLRQLRSQVMANKEVLDVAYSQVIVGGIEMADMSIFAKAWDVWKSSLDSLWEAEQELRRRLENRSALGAIERKSVLIEELAEEYGSIGPQYRHLIDLLASVTVRMETLERSDRPVDGGEFAELAKMRLATINQLQKYREATKSLALKDDVNKAVVESIKIARQVFGHYAREWEVYINEVMKAVESRDDAA